MASANDFFHKVGRSTATTLASPGYTTGDTSINVASTTNWPADTGVTFAIDEVDSNGLRVSGTYNVFRGKVAGGTQIDEVTYVGGDTNRNYSAGATTRVYILVSSYRDNRFTDGILEEHKQDGTHGDVNADSLDVSGASNLTDLSVSGTLSLPAGSLETADYGNASVTGEKIANYKIVRQNNTSNSTENTARILTGWGVIAMGGVATGTEVVTFDSAFTSIPIVTLTYGGDNASSTTYGSGSINLKQAYGGAVSLTTTTFTAYIRSADGTNWPGGAQAFYQWTAIGV